MDAIDTPPTTFEPIGLHALRIVETLAREQGRRLVLSSPPLPISCPCVSATGSAFPKLTGNRRGQITVRDSLKFGPPKGPAAHGKPPG